MRPGTSGSLDRRQLLVSSACCSFEEMVRYSGFGHGVLDLQEKVEPPA